MNSLFWSKLQCYCKVIQCIIFYFAAWSIPRPRNIGYLTHYYRTFLFCTTAVRAWFTLPEIIWTRAQWKLPSARLPLVINTGHNLLEFLGKAKGAGFRVQSLEFRWGSFEGWQDSGWSMRSSVSQEGLCLELLLHHMNRSQLEWFRYLTRTYPGTS